MKNVSFLYYLSLVVWCCGSYGATTSIAEEDYEQFLSPEAKTALSHRFLSPAKRIEAEEQGRLSLFSPHKNPTLAIEWEWERNRMKYKSEQQFDPSTGRETVAQILLRTLPMEPWIVVWDRAGWRPL